MQFFFEFRTFQKNVFKDSFQRKSSSMLVTTLLSNLFLHMQFKIFHFMCSAFNNILSIIILYGISALHI